MMATLETASAAENVLLIQRMEKGKVIDRLLKVIKIIKRNLPSNIFRDTAVSKEKRIFWRFHN
jgi:hypothetical protein